MIWIGLSRIFGGDFLKEKLVISLSNLGVLCALLKSRWSRISKMSAVNLALVKAWMETSYQT
jgi:hypothetical protein